jgi:hypothetical protein
LHNTVTATTRGAAITVNPQVADSPVTGLVMRGNTVTDNAFSGFTTGGLANLTGASIVANTFSRNGRQGIALAPGTGANRLLDNVTEGNAQYGIRLFPGTHDILLVRNRMLSNGLADAVDETRGHDRRRHGAGQPLGTQHLHSRRPASSPEAMAWSRSVSSSSASGRASSRTRTERPSGRVAGTWSTWPLLVVA